MIAELEKWKEGWQGISLGLRNDEIDHLITLLQEIRNDNDQHFHISSDCKGEPGLGGIELYVKSDTEKDNMYFSSLAKGPGEEI
ncbi:MAG: hypothetical protein GY834_12530 [Bacteroidetes bacterium]|nr:hypothetical protein [Bacteroidota bacterium]